MKNRYVPAVVIGLLMMGVLSVYSQGRSPIEIRRGGGAGGGGSGNNATGTYFFNERQFTLDDTNVSAKSGAHFTNASLWGTTTNNGDLNVGAVLRVANDAFFTNGVYTHAGVVFREDFDGDFVGISVPSILPGSYSFLLPSTNGLAGQAMVLGGGGAMYWEDVAMAANTNSFNPNQFTITGASNTVSLKSGNLQTNSIIRDIDVYSGSMTGKHVRIGHTGFPTHTNPNLFLYATNNLPSANPAAITLMTAGDSSGGFSDFNDRMGAIYFVGSQGANLPRTLPGISIIGTTINNDFSQLDFSLVVNAAVAPVFTIRNSDVIVQDVASFVVESNAFVGNMLVVTNWITNYGGIFTRGDFIMTKDQAAPIMTMNSLGGAGNASILSVKTGGTEAAPTNTANQTLFQLSAYGSSGLAASAGMDFFVKAIGESRATEGETLLVFAIGSSNKFGFTRDPILSMRPFAITNHADIRGLSNLWLNEDIELYDDDQSQSLGLASSAVMPSSYTIVFPSTNGLSGQTLVNDGLGFMYWAAGGVGGGATSSYSFNPNQFGLTQVTNVTLTNGVRVTNMNTYASVINHGINTNLSVTYAMGDYFRISDAGAPVYWNYLSTNSSSASDAPAYISVRQRGSSQVPENLEGGDQVGYINMYGFRDTQVGIAFQVSASTIGDWSDSHAETLVVMKVGSSNSVPAVNAISIRATGITNHLDTYFNDDAIVRNDLILRDDDASQSITIRAASAVGTGYALDLPTGQGSDGQVMTNNGSGVMGWWTPVSFGGAITGAYVFNNSQFTAVNETNISFKTLGMVTNLQVHHAQSGAGIALNILAYPGIAANLVSFVDTNFGVHVSVNSNASLLMASNVVLNGFLSAQNITNMGVFTNNGGVFVEGNFTIDGEGFQYIDTLDIIRYSALSEIQWFPVNQASGGALIQDFIGAQGKIAITRLQSLTSSITNRLEAWETNALDIGFDTVRGAWNISPGFADGVVAGGYVRPLVIDRVMEISKWTNTVVFAAPKTTIPFNTNDYLYINATANTGFNTTNRDLVKLGVTTKEVYIRATGGDWTFTNNPNWKIMGNSTFTIPSGKIGRMTLELHGTSESDVVASFLIQDEIAAGGGGITNSYIFNGNQFSVQNQTNVTIKNSAFLTNVISYDGSFSAISENGTTVNFISQTFNDTSFEHGGLTIQRASGTMAAPNNTDAGDSLGDILIQGYGDTTYKGGMWIIATAVSGFTDANSETLAVISIGRSNSSVNVPVMSIRGHVVTNHVDLRVNSNIWVRDEIKFEDNDGSASVMIQAAPTMSASYDLLWPPAQATVAGQVLTNDAAGNLGWWTLIGGGGGGITNSYTFHGDHFTVINETNVSIKIGPQISNVVVRAQAIGDLPLQVIGRPGGNTNTFAVSWTNGLTHTFVVTSNGMTVASNLVAQNNITVSNALLLVNDAGSSNITFQAPATFASYSLTLPTTNGLANQVLAANGSGVLFWKTDDNSGGAGGGLLMNSDQFATNTTTAWIKEQALLTNSIFRGTTTGTNLVVVMRTANGNNPFQVQFTNLNPVFTVGSNGVTTASNITVFNDLTVNDTIVLPDDDASLQLTIQSAGTMSGSYTLTMPPNAGAVGQILTNGGSGTLGWGPANSFSVITNWNIIWNTNQVPFATTHNADFNTNMHLMDLTGDITFNTTNRVVGKAIDMSIFLRAGTTNRVIIFNSDWKLLSGSRTNVLGSNKVAVISLRHYGFTNAETNVLASWAPEQ